MTHLQKAENINSTTSSASQPVIDLLIEHIKQQDEFIARLQKAVEYLGKLVDRHEGENSLNRPLI